MKLKIFATGLLAALAPVCGYADYNVQGGNYCSTNQAATQGMPHRCTSNSTYNATLFPYSGDQSTKHCKTTRKRTWYSFGKDASYPYGQCETITVTDCAECVTGYDIHTTTPKGGDIYFHETSNHTATSLSSCIQVQTCETTAAKNECNPVHGQNGQINSDCPNNDNAYTCNESTGNCHFTEYYTCRYDSSVSKNICTPITDYNQCMVGFYGDGNTCTKCPSPGTTVADETIPATAWSGAISAYDCYIPEGYTYNDNTGDLLFTADCGYDD